MSVNTYTVKTKRDLLNELYNQIQIEINEKIDLSYIFPPSSEIDFADIVFNISFLLPPGCNTRETLLVLIKDASVMYNIDYTDEQIDKVIPIVQKFLSKYYTL